MISVKTQMLLTNDIKPATFVEVAVDIDELTILKSTVAVASEVPDPVAVAADSVYENLEQCLGDFLRTRGITESKFKDAVTYDFVRHPEISVVKGGHVAGKMLRRKGTEVIVGGVATTRTSYN